MVRITNTMNYTVHIKGNARTIGDFHNVFKFYAYSVNKTLFLMTAKLAGACPTWQQLMYAKWIPAIKIVLKEAGE